MSRRKKLRHSAPQKPKPVDRCAGLDPAPVYHSETSVHLFVDENGCVVTREWFWSHVIRDRDEGH